MSDAFMVSDFFVMTERSELQRSPDGGGSHSNGIVRLPAIGTHLNELLVQEPRFLFLQDHHSNGIVHRHRTVCTWRTLDCLFRNFPEKFPRNPTETFWGKFHWNCSDAVHGTLLVKKLKKFAENLDSSEKSCIFALSKKEETTHKQNNNTLNQ